MISFSQCLDAKNIRILLKCLLKFLSDVLSYLPAITSLYFTFIVSYCIHCIAVVCVTVLLHILMIMLEYLFIVYFSLIYTYAHIKQHNILQHYSLLYSLLPIKLIIFNIKQIVSLLAILMTEIMKTYHGIITELSRCYTVLYHPVTVLYCPDNKQYCLVHILYSTVLSGFYILLYCRHITYTTRNIHKNAI